MYRRSTAALGVAIVVVGGLVAPAVASAAASGPRPKVTIVSGPTVAGTTASLTYSVNRPPKTIRSRSCTLETATTRTYVGCGALPRTTAPRTRVCVVLRNLADGTYTFTVRATFRDGGLAATRSRPFTIESGPIVDQSNPNDQDPAGTFAMDVLCTTAYDTFGQTFTAGRTGRLTSISLYGTAIGDEPIPLVVDIYAAGLNGQPTGSSLGTGTHTGAGDAVTGFEVPLQQPVPLTQGSQYAITWTLVGCNNPPSWNFLGSNDDSYPAGETLVHDDNEGWAGVFGWDFYFTTWMTG